LAGLHETFSADTQSIIRIELPYEITSVNVDSQVVHIKAANPDIFINLATPKFAAQAIRKAGELGWRPVQFLSNVSSSAGNVLVPAGIENSKGVITAGYIKDASDPQWKNDEGVKEFRAFMAKYYPEGDPWNGTTIFAYGAAKSLVQILKQCGDDLTRGNIMKQMSSLDMQINVYLPGVKIKTSPADYAAISQLQLLKFNGERLEQFGSVIDGK
jgi:branched-chain amino acid transport system substrate-binding protein